jgi:hypothetical protein
MYIDYQARLSDKQSLVAAASAITSTYILDTIQSGWGADDEVYARFQVGTVFAASAASSLTLAIQIAQDTGFATLITCATKVLAANGGVGMTANAIPWVVKLPVSMMTGQTGGDTLYNASGLPYRYLRVLYTSTFAIITGTISCQLVKDTPVTIDRPL